MLILTKSTDKCLQHTLIACHCLNGLNGNNSCGAEIRFSNLVTREAAFHQNDQNGIYKFQQDLLPWFNQLAPKPSSGHILCW